jgi:hypothetical protein
MQKSLRFFLNVAGCVSVLSMSVFSSQAKDIRLKTRLFEPFRIDYRALNETAKIIKSKNDYTILVLRKERQDATTIYFDFCIAKYFEHQDSVVRNKIRHFVNTYSLMWGQDISSFAPQNQRDFLAAYNDCANHVYENYSYPNSIHLGYNQRIDSFILKIPVQKVGTPLYMLKPDEPHFLYEKKYFYSDLHSIWPDSSVFVVRNLEQKVVFSEVTTSNIDHITYSQTMKSKTTFFSNEGVPMIFFEELADIKYSNQPTEIIGFAIGNRRVPHKYATFESRIYKMDNDCNRLVNFTKYRTSYIDTFKYEEFYRHGLFKVSVDYENLSKERIGLFLRMFSSEPQQNLINETFVYYNSNLEFFEFQAGRNSGFNPKEYFVNRVILIHRTEGVTLKKLRKNLKSNTIHVWEDFEVFWFEN